MNSNLKLIWRTLVENIPAVAITVHALEGDRQKFLVAGFDACQARQHSFEDLRNALEAT